MFAKTGEMLMFNGRPTYTRAAGLILAFTLAGCAKKTADVELGLAGDALKAAQRARDCAPERYRAAEQALMSARKLAEAGDIDVAKAEAGRAESLARQAAKDSPPGCVEALAAAKAANEPEPEPEITDAARKLQMLSSALNTVYFDYNQYVIREESKAALTAVADALRQLPRESIDIEGHCDVRGSTEYNLHLGERRARSVLKYLVTQGVDPDQLRTISYGEERPADFGFTEDSHAANRRAELRGP